jgi:NAD+ diphosphatase
MDAPKLDNYIFFGHDTVNRFSFLRDDEEFIQLALKDKSTKIVVIAKGAPLGYKDESKLYYARYEELPLLEKWLEENKTGANLDRLRVTFLGVDESFTGVQYKNYAGLPYFAVDLTHCQEEYDELTSKGGLELYTDRRTIFNLSNFDASIVSHGKMYLDWLDRNRFCAGCGQRTLAIHAGTKLLCSSPKVQGCPVKNASVSNVSFPRTDCVVISAITSRDFSKVLLGRGKRFPGNMYSCIAGFMEPSETIEVASLREVWEETGVKGSEVQIFKSQPWPYPANLMIGCVVCVDLNGSNEVINLGHDPELHDAKWVDITEIKEMLGGAKRDWFLPPSNAIAHDLIKYVADQYDKLYK